MDEIHLDLTASCDGTTNRHVNLEARHIALQVEPYLQPTAPPIDRGLPSDSSTTFSQSIPPKVRLLGVDASVDHTSETQLKGWKCKMEEISTLYGESPLSKRTQTKVGPNDFVLKLHGMNGDHAEDQKKTFRLMGAWKEEATCIHLGEQAMIALLTESWEIMRPLVENAVEKKITHAGGPEAWILLSPAEQHEHDIIMMHDLSICVGKEVFSKLPDSVRQSLKFLIWAGCSMHKELNSVKGGDRAMQAAWYSLSLEPPVLLANKDNAATLALGSTASTSKVVTAAEQCALEVSNRGAVKMASLAGALFNHKDDKKGQQDTHRNYMRKITGKPFMFPDTLNTRYQTHCEAAAELLVNLQHYLTFLELVRDKKEKCGFNHMEGNIYMALQDIPTLTELAVLVLYAQSVTHPYMRIVRGSGTEQVNILDLGPLHEDVKKHIQDVLTNPALLLSPDASFIAGAMDGKPWEWMEAVEAVHKLAPHLPHLELMLIVFFTGTLVTWERFTTEFAPGGLIDLATAAERESAWMPSTNDANEGALGSYRLAKRTKPGITQHMYNAQAKHRRNDTHTFMSSLFTDEDHAFLIAKARLLDSSKLEDKIRDDQVEFDQRVVDVKRKRDEERRAKEVSEVERLGKIMLITDEAVIEQMKNGELEEQLECLRQWDKPAAGSKKGVLLCKTHFKQLKRDDRRAYLAGVISEFTARFSLENNAHFIREMPNVDAAPARITDDWESDDGFDS